MPWSSCSLGQLTPLVVRTVISARTTYRERLLRRHFFLRMEAMTGDDFPARRHRDERFQLPHHTWQFFLCGHPDFAGRMSRTIRSVACSEKQLCRFRAGFEDVPQSTKGL